MPDVHTPDQRRFNMSRIRGQDTKPERIVRGMLHRMGYRFRLHRRDLPGTPDIVLARHSKIVEVRGCYWHRHNCRFGRVEPKTNAEFWQAKRDATVERDRRNISELRRQGWAVLIVWECQTRDEAVLLKQLQTFMAN